MRTFLSTLATFSFAIMSRVLAAAEMVNANSEGSRVLAGEGLSDPNVAGSLIQTTLGLLVVLAVIGGAAWAFKRFGNFQTGVQGKLKVIGGISLGSRERVVLLQVGSEQLVVGVAPGSIQTLHVLSETLPVEELKEDSPSFSKRLQSAMLAATNKNLNNNTNSNDAPDQEPDVKR